MFKRMMIAVAVPLLGIGLAGAAALATAQNDECCCVVNDDGKLVCTETGQVLETCCCE